MKNKLSNRIFGKEVEGAYEKFLEKLKERKVSQPVPKEVPTSLDGINLSDYIFNPNNGIYVAKTRMHMNNNWYKAHEELQKEKARMLTIKEFIDFLALLKSGNVQDGLGNKIQASELDSLYKDITEKIGSYRAEWLDADFKLINGILHINYAHRNVNGQLQPQNSEPLERCLMADCYADLFSANKQGLPTKQSSKKDFYYYFPRSDNNSVAGFNAYSDWAYLDCYGDPECSYASLGVRAVRIKPT